MFVYNSPVGLMKIIFSNSNNRYSLIINDVNYGSYHSAIAAADDVFTQVTGCDEWDSFDSSSMDIPTDIYEWGKVTL